MKNCVNSHGWSNSQMVRSKGTHEPYKCKDWSVECINP